MAAKYTDTITTDAGTALEGATVELLTGAGALVTTYTDDALTQNAATSRTTDANGLVELYVADGTYSVRTTYNGVVKTLANVELYDISTIASTSSGAVANKAQASAIGIGGSAENMGSYTGSTIPDNETAKQNIQSLEAAVETKANASAVGVTSSAANMGTFTGSTIPDNQTAKQALQALETETETKSTALGIAGGATNLGTFTGSTISDNGTVKAGMQELEAAVEARALSAFSHSATYAASTVGKKLQQTVSIKDAPYNAVGDGVTDDTAAIQAALSSGAAAIYVPAGRYKITAHLTRSGSTYLYGDGLTKSAFVMTGNFSFQFTGGAGGDHYDASLLHIERVAFETTVDSTVPGIDARWTDGTGGTSKTLIIRDVDITGINASTGFEKGIYLLNARNVVIESTRIHGRRDTSPLTSGFGVHIEGGNPNGAPVEIFLTKVQVFYTATAFDIDGWVEGIYFTRCTAIACHTGIDASATPAGRPLISVIGCHLFTNKYGIITGEYVQTDFSHNLIYGAEVDSTSTNYAAITLGSVTDQLDSHICDNTILGLITGIPKNGIVMSGGAASDSSKLSGNIIKSFDSGILLGATANNVVVTGDNIFTSCTTNVTNSGSGNIICYATKASVGQRIDPDGLIEKWGSSVIALNASGDGTVTFATAFPTGFLQGMVCNGDPTISGPDSFSINQTGCNASGLAFSVRPNPGAINVRVNWTAKGN